MRPQHQIHLAEEKEFEQIEVERLSRDDFINEVFKPHYEAGQHVTVVGPTGCGKTTLVLEMVNAVATPKLPAIILVKKPRDEVIQRWLKLTGFKKTEVWPPITRRGFTKKSGGFLQKRRGWVFWPRQYLKDLRVDKKRLSREFEKVMSESYRKGNRILFVDDLVGFSKEYGLEEVMTIIYMEGRAMGCGMWGAIQRPYHAPVIMYGAAEHVILFKDPDRRSVERFKEIGGVDPDIVEYQVNNLKKHQALYIGRNMAPDGVSPALAIIESE